MILNRQCRDCYVELEGNALVDGYYGLCSTCEAAMDAPPSVSKTSGDGIPATDVPAVESLTCHAPVREPEEAGTYYCAACKDVGCSECNVPDVNDDHNAAEMERHRPSDAKHWDISPECAAGCQPGASPCEACRYWNYGAQHPNEAPHAQLNTCGQCGGTGQAPAIRGNYFVLGETMPCPACMARAQQALDAQRPQDPLPKNSTLPTLEDAGRFIAQLYDARQEDGFRRGIRYVSEMFDGWLGQHLPRPGEAVTIDRCAVCRAPTDASTRAVFGDYATCSERCADVWLDAVVGQGRRIRELREEIAALKAGARAPTERSLRERAGAWLLERGFCSSDDGEVDQDDITSLVDLLRLNEAMKHSCDNCSGVDPETCLYSICEQVQRRDKGDRASRSQPAELPRTDKVGKISLCGAETTIRDDEHRTYVCDRPKGHDGDHWARTVTVEWTDETTTYPELKDLSEDEKTMILVANYVDEWRHGDNSGHAVGHLREVFMLRSETAKQKSTNDHRGRAIHFLWSLGEGDHDDETKEALAAQFAEVEKMAHTSAAQPEAYPDETAQAFINGRALGRKEAIADCAKWLRKNEDRIFDMIDDMKENRSSLEIAADELEAGAVPTGSGAEVKP